MPGPHVAVAHSMGGHLLLRHLARGGSPLGRAALLAPMLGVRPAPPPLRRLAKLLAGLGLGDRFALAQRPYGPWQDRPERQDVLSGSPERFAQEHVWLAAHPEWSLGGVTWGWIAAAQRSLDILAAPGVLEGIAMPALTLVGERERLVDSRMAARLGNGRYEIIADGRHELLRDADGPRLATLAALKAFLLP
jgi:lysophospholipase